MGKREQFETQLRGRYTSNGTLLNCFDYHPHATNITDQGVGKCIEHNRTTTGAQTEHLEVEMKQNT